MRPFLQKLPALLCLSVAAHLSVQLKTTESNSSAAYDGSVSAARLETRTAWALPQDHKTSQTLISNPEEPLVSTPVPGSPQGTPAATTVNDVMALLSIPALGDAAKDIPLRLGTGGAALDLGAALYPNGVLPGDLGSLPIVGHRTSHGKPFEHLDVLRPGDMVVLETSSERYTYTIFDSTVVDDEDTWVLSDTPVDAVSGRQSLTLITCTPKGSTSHRLVVFAVLSQVAAKPTRQ